MVEIRLVCAAAPSRVQWREERIEDCTCQVRVNPFNCLLQLSHKLENKSSPSNVSDKTIYRLCRHLTRLLVKAELTKVGESMELIGYLLLRRKNALAGNYAHVVLEALKPVPVLRLTPPGINRRQATPSLVLLRIRVSESKRLCDTIQVKITMGTIVASLVGVECCHQYCLRKRD